MAVLRDVSLPLANYPSGTRNLPERDVPDSATALFFEFSRCTDATPNIWPNAATTMKMDFETSVNGGAWIAAGGFQSAGGIASKNGVQTTFTRVLWPLPQGTSRRVRATLTITNGPLRTEGAMELRD